MQYAKKLALIDPKILEQLQVDREYKVIQRPAPTVAKSSLSLDIGRILDDQTIPDDEKVKLYQNALRRYTNIRNVIPTQVTEVPPPPPPPAAAIPTPLPPVILPPPRVASPLTSKSPRLFSIGAKQVASVKPLHIRKKPVKWETIRELPKRSRRKPIKWQGY